MKHKDRVAVVTGAGMGIGWEIAQRFAGEGVMVGLVDKSPQHVEQAQRQLEQTGARVCGIACDVSCVEQVERMVEQVADELGGIDILVNNAGVLYSTPVEDIAQQEWDEVQDVNLKGLFFAIQKALPYLKQSSCARIINISSVAGRMGSYNSGMSYVAAKGGVLSLTRGLARRLAPHQITVNAVCPGTIASDMIRQWSPEAIEQLVQHIPLGRLGQPQEVAAAVAFLASQEAGFITGVSLDVNGGMYMA